MARYILAIDQGTTHSRAVIFNPSGQLIQQHQLEMTQYYPQDAWVEHDPEEIWRTTMTCCKAVMAEASLKPSDVISIGISNQRETTILWNRKTGQFISRAIVWQDRRTANFCNQLKAQPEVSDLVTKKTGLLIDPYFSASKIRWLLDNIPSAREAAERGELAFGTVDSYLLWRLTDGQQHLTDATNASRTLLFNIHTQKWDSELLALFDIPSTLLPEVRDNASQFGVTHPKHFGQQIPITGMVGDQQAATIGQTCFQSGMIKSTYGTGGFLLLNTGSQCVFSKHNLLSTIAYRFNGNTTYGLEGSIFSTGATIKWLRDNLHFIKSENEVNALVNSVDSTGGVYLVPGFTGLGAPYWDPDARGALIGLTCNTQIPHIVRAALEAVAYQTRDLMQAMTQDTKTPLETLRVDGGMASNDWLLEFLSGMLAMNVERPFITETSALGAAYCAGLGAGVYHSLDEIKTLWKIKKQFSPKMDKECREHLWKGWQKAIKQTIFTPNRSR